MLQDVGFQIITGVRIDYASCSPLPTPTRFPSHIPVPSPPPNKFLSHIDYMLKFMKPFIKKTMDVKGIEIVVLGL